MIEKIFFSKLCSTPGLADFFLCRYFSIKSVQASQHRIKMKQNLANNV